VSVALRKIPGVESVETSLNQGKAFVRLKPGNSVRFDDLIQRIHDNGFTPKEAKVTVRGELLSVGGKLRLRVLGIGQTYDLVLPSSPPGGGELGRQAGKAITVEGVIPAPEGRAPPTVIRATAWKTAP
jgi:copper chaperone CopZ